MGLLSFKQYQGQIFGMDTITMNNADYTNQEELFFEGDQLALKTTILVGTYQGSKEKQNCQDHLDELEDLAQTYGLTVLEKIACHIRKYDASTYIGKGKVQETVEMAKENGADCILFDEEILPSQQRNLEKNFQLPVLDRTELILGIFAQRAQTKEAKLQVELAQTRYKLPRLKRFWTHLSRQRGGGSHLKGEGEKQIEIDKRLLKQRVDRISSELKEVRLHRETQRSLRVRTGIPTFAIIGYTNAGKSTLLNTLTEAGVFVEDKLFATLDTTTKRFTLPNQQEILLIDTVGFIRKIPHTLVAAFKSTLEEALYADILLHLVDVNHPLALEHAEATYDVFKELKVENSPPIITVLNKIDALDNPHSTVSKFRVRYPKTIAISAKEGTGLDTLALTMEKELAALRQTMLLRVPQREYHLVSEIQRDGLIHHQEYEENDVLLKADIPIRLVSRLKKYER